MRHVNGYSEAAAKCAAEMARPMTRQQAEAAIAMADAGIHPNERRALDDILREVQELTETGRDSVCAQLADVEEQDAERFDGLE